jgi:hypothetical protein
MAKPECARAGLELDHLADGLHAIEPGVFLGGGLEGRCGDEVRDVLLGEPLALRQRSAATTES